MNRLFLFLLAILSAQPLQSAEKIVWLQKYDLATAEARRTGRPIFVDVYADWCQWCHKLDRDVYATPQFVEYMKGYVPLKLDSEDKGEGARLSDRYGVEGLPAMLVVSADGKLLDRITGYKGADELIQEVERTRKLLLLDKPPGNEDANFLLAKAYVDKEMYPEARERFRRLLSSPAASAVQKEKALFSIALTEYYEGDLKSALSDMEIYYHRYPDGASGEDALLLLSQIYIETDANEKALKCLREFMKKYPNSHNTARAQQVLKALEAACPNC